MNIVEWIQTHYMPLVNSMMNCSHHSFENQSLNPYHLEGDVWSHTLLTLEKAKDLNKLIQFALLCHDIAKPDFRNDSGGKVSFKGHELFSAYKSIPIAKQFGFSKEEQLKIFQLIAYHTSILKKLDNDNCLPEVLAQHKGHPDLFLDILSMTYADGLGRIMNEYNNKLHYLEDYFSGIFDTMTNQPLIKQDNQGTVTCLIGLPASGKSTYLKDNKINTKNIIERDSIANELKIPLGQKLNKKDKDSIFHTIENKKKVLVQNKEDIYIDMVNLLDRDRYQSLKNIPRNYWFKAIIFVNDLETLKERNNSRDKKVPWDYINYQLRNSSLPLFDEFDEIEWRCDA